MTVNACEIEAGKDRVLHLAINSGTDLALFNAWLTYIADKGWIDKDFIAGLDRRTSTRRSAANKTSLEEAAKITGLDASIEIRKAAEWIAQPKDGRQAPPDDVRLREGPDLGQRQLPHQRRAREHRAGDRQRRAIPAAAACAWAAIRKATCAPTTPVGRPAAYVDKLLIERQGRRPPHLGLRSLQDHAERRQVQAGLQEAHRPGEGRDVRGSLRRPQGDGRRRSSRAIGKGGLFAVDVDIVPTKIGQACHVWLPAATAGEMNLTSMNGERRLRLTERYMDPPGQAMPDCLIAARLANNLERVFREMGKARRRRQVQGLRLEDRGRRLHGRLSRQRQGRRVRHL